MESKAQIFERAIAEFGIEAALEYFDVPKEKWDLFKSIPPSGQAGKKPEGEVLNHNYYVMKDYDGKFELWTKSVYQQYIKGAVTVGGGSAYKLVIGFNGDEDYLFPTSHPVNGDVDEWIPISKINTLSKGDHIKIIVKVTGLEDRFVHTDIGLVPKKDITDVLPKNRNKNEAI